LLNLKVSIEVTGTGGNVHTLSTGLLQRYY